MALDLALRTAAVCSQSPYSQFTGLQGFAPAISFCTAFEVNSKVPSSGFGCPNGSNLCNVLSSLSSCEISVITQACICIGVTPSTTVTVPKTSSTPSSSTKTTATSKATSQTNSVKSSSVTWATSTSSPKATTPSQTTLKASSNQATGTCTAVTVTVYPSTCSSAPAATPTCQDGVELIQPPPAGLVCDQAGTVGPGNWDVLTDGSATSTSDCAAQCLAVGCGTIEYDYATQDCQMFSDGVDTLGFVAVPDSPFIVSENGCYVAC